MGKRIITQARGKGSHTYRVKRRAFRFKIQIPRGLEKDSIGEVVKLIDSGAHTAPLAKIKHSGSGEGKDKTFYIPAFRGMVEGQKIGILNGKSEKGNILELKDIPAKTQIYCIESKPNDGGKFIKAGGNSAMVVRQSEDNVFILLPSKREKKLNPRCRAVVGVVAGSGRLDKPVMKAGKKFYIKKTKSKLWPRTSAVKMNAIDHPFGSGRAKNPKSKIAKRNAPPGRRVGLLRPRRTGKKK